MTLAELEEIIKTRLDNSEKIFSSIYGYEKLYQVFTYQIRASPLRTFVECYHNLIADSIFELVLKKPIVNTPNEETTSITTTSTTTSTTSIITKSSRETSDQLDPAEMMILLEKCEQFQRTCYEKLKDLASDSVLCVETVLTTQSANSDQKHFALYGSTPSDPALCARAGSLRESDQRPDLNELTSTRYTFQVIEC